jgi:hypothetical protein
VAAVDAPERNPVIVELQERFVAAYRAERPSQSLRQPVTSARHLLLLTAMSGSTAVCSPSVAMTDHPAVSPGVARACNQHARVMRV